MYGFKSKFGVISKLPGMDKLYISRWDLFNAGGVYTDGMLRGYPEYEFGGRSRDPATGLSLLAFSTYPRGEIYVADADGTSVRRLTENYAEDMWPSWSPDGADAASGTRSSLTSSADASTTG